ncbi:hypothetical protein B0H11DRAFT_1942002 [Mycena galericulata]|nr:hypothetical protein B0H11DRAFT_1942002 [Mycena galericulata]
MYHTSCPSPRAHAPPLCLLAKQRLGQGLSLHSAPCQSQRGSAVPRHRRSSSYRYAQGGIKSEAQVEEEGAGAEEGGGGANEELEDDEVRSSNGSGGAASEGVVDGEYGSRWAPVSAGRAAGGGKRKEAALIGSRDGSDRKGPRTHRKLSDLLNARCKAFNGSQSLTIHRIFRHVVRTSFHKETKITFPSELDAGVPQIDGRNEVFATQGKYSPLWFPQPTQYDHGIPTVVI